MLEAASGYFVERVPIPGRPSVTAAVAATAAPKAAAASTAAPGQDTAKAAADGTSADTGKGFQPFGADGFTFSDLVDIVNPLQHIPVVSTIYRALTGDTLSPASRVAGDTLYGGPIGAAIGLVNVAVEETTGQDIGANVLAMLSGDEAKPTAPAVAQATTDKTATDTMVAATSQAASQATVPAASRGIAQVVFPAAAAAASFPGTPPPTSTKAAAAPSAAPVPAGVPARLSPQTMAAVLSNVDEASGLADATASGKTTAKTAAPAAATASATPSGDAAADGGWFSRTMLSALDRYYAEHPEAKPAANAAGGSGF